MEFEILDEPQGLAELPEGNRAGGVAPGVPAGIAPPHLAVRPAWQAGEGADPYADGPVTPHQQA